ncbi:hypothetical protein CGC20_10495 [Leishmania donovani]|uniref:Uncharacterized protein n=1 Tax=Leishmania donovani TaxID=5661 RepID=A0A504Y5K0_LEIDO|nr:hypothetical protein CGC20_10495 [Leishmania donovani]
MPSPEGPGAGLRFTTPTETAIVKHVGCTESGSRRIQTPSCTASGVKGGLGSRGTNGPKILAALSAPRGSTIRENPQRALKAGLPVDRYPRMGVDSPQGTAAYFWLRLRPSSWGPDVRKTFSRIAAQRLLTFTAPMPLAPRSSTGAQRKASWGGEASVHSYVDSSVTAKPSRRLHKGQGSISSPFLITGGRLDTEENVPLEGSEATHG